MCEEEELHLKEVLGVGVGVDEDLAHRVVHLRVLAPLLHEQLQELLEEAPKWRREARERIKELNRDATRFAIGHAIAQTKRPYADLAEAK